MKIYILTGYFLYPRIGCCITVNHWTTLLWLSVWDLIARQNMWMPTKQSCLNLITSGSSICKVKRMSSITLSIDRFLSFLYYTSAGPHWIGFSNFRRAFPPENQYQPCLGGPKRLNDGYYVPKLKNMVRWFQQSTKISMVGLIVLMGSSGLSNRLI